MTLAYDKYTSDTSECIDRCFGGTLSVKLLTAASAT